MIEQRPPQPSQDEIRAEITKKIWGMAVGMLAICIPLAPTTGSGPMIPIFVLIAAAAGTIGIWGSKNNSAPRLSAGKAAEDAATQKRVLELEERLAALESITNFEHKLIEAKYPNAAPASAAPTFTFETPGGVMADSSVTSPSAGARPVAQSG